MRDSATVDRQMHYFAMLTQEEQAMAICRMAASGMGVSVIATATQLSVEMITKILGEKTAESKS